MTNIQTSQRNNLFTLLIFLSILLTLMTVVLSAYLRLSLNGLNCTPWPECYGYVGPLEQYDAAASFTDAQPQKPHGLARLLHRAVASVLGIFVVVILLMAFRQRKHGGVGIALPLGVFAITVFLSVLGYSTPSPWIPAVTLGNLLGGMLMLAMLWWMGQTSVAKPQPANDGMSSLKLWALLGLVIIISQIFLGAWVSGNFAGPSCPGLGTCNDSWLPASGLTDAFNLLRELEVSATGMIVADNAMPTIHMLHRLGAILTTVYLIWLGIKALRIGGDIKSTAITMLVFLVLQIGLGISAVLGSLPLSIVTAHNTVAALLLLSVTNMNQIVFRKSTA